MKLKIKKIFSVITLVIANFILNVFRRDLYKKDIWLIEEKPTEARDNGYHFFKYLRENHPEINAYYAITFDSSDLYKIKKYGNIIKYNSFKHYIYYLAAKNSINSQPFGATPDHAAFIHRFKKLRRKDQNTIYLKHGIYKDELAHSLDYNKTGFNLVCCASTRELNFIRKTYGYPEKSAQLLGLCRYDNLHNIENKIKKQILIMPTFRSWLVAADRTKDALKNEVAKFSKSDYYNAFSTLLSNEKFNKILETSGYKAVFYPHYSIQSYIKCFKEFENENIIIADRKNYDVQNLMIESKIMVTDFSSVFFDFAYMKKPEVFFQFDEDKFRANHYKKGYFDYRDDGFGPVVTTVDDLVEKLCEIIGNDSKVSDFYMERINSFFDLCDDKNCERTYNAIVELN